MSIDFEERKREKIDNDRLCELLNGYYKNGFWNWIDCYFPRGCDFSMPYNKPHIHSICFARADKDPILVEYTPGFDSEKAHTFMRSLDWNFLFQHSTKENNQVVFHGIYNKTDKFDLTIPPEFCKVLSAYITPPRETPKTKKGSKTPKTK